MIIKSRAPLRIGLAGGGTDVAPYCNEFGGCILNTTIDMYAYATITPTNDKQIILETKDRDESFSCSSTQFIENGDNVALLKAVYNRIVRDFNLPALSFKLSTYVDAPAGSGLGSSSTLVVAIVKAFVEWLNLPLDDYSIAQLAWSIEREDLGMSGGLQDQYAAAFGGFNFMQFGDSQKVLVNPLRIKQAYLNELEFDLLLYYTGISRCSSQIIDSQIKNMTKQQNNEALHQIKQSVYDMKEALLTGQLLKIGEILHQAWISKKKTSNLISNPFIDDLYTTALAAGATGGKISGAGGGGFFMFFCPGNSRYSVIKALQKFAGEFKSFSFTKRGVESWTV